jgi:hypothetical protein
VIGNISTVAVAMNELYESFLEAGFSKKQAFTLTRDQWRLLMMMNLPTADDSDE